jgi:hypothetical protein
MTEEMPPFFAFMVWKKKNCSKKPDNSPKYLEVDNFQKMNTIFSKPSTTVLPMTLNSSANSPKTLKEFPKKPQPVLPDFTNWNHKEN